MESLYAAGSCRELERACMRVQREAGIRAIDQREPLPIGFRNDILADDVAFFFVVPVVLRPPPCKKFLA